VSQHDPEIEFLREALGPVSPPPGFRERVLSAGLPRGRDGRSRLALAGSLAAAYLLGLLSALLAVGGGGATSLPSFDIPLDSIADTPPAPDAPLPVVPPAPDVEDDLLPRIS
jgi:hypothetical protein